LPFLSTSVLVAEICQNETCPLLVWDAGSFHPGMKCFHMRFKYAANWQMDGYPLSPIQKVCRRLNFVRHAI
jgi:hypothetical protein